MHNLALYDGSGLHWPRFVSPRTETQKSFVEIDKIYLWTATINNWNKLLADDVMKDIVLSSLKYLSDEKKIEVYAFVIMPNHLHFV